MGQEHGGSAVSAYICENELFEKIGYFVDVYTKRPKFSDEPGLWLHRKGDSPSGNRMSGQRVAEILMRENVRSVNYRYEERSRSPKLKVPKQGKVPTPGEICRLCARLEYQSNERRGYFKSDGFRVLNLVRELALQVATNNIDGDW
jgi:hypothetical protein